MVIVTNAAYGPFGQPTLTGEESYLYTGKEIDATGLSYYGARDYDPGLGRFITRDPLAGKRIIPQSPNRYTSCLNNPVKFIDPEGLTYSICNVDTGICYTYYEWRNPKRGPAWTAYDANGDRITDSQELEELMTSEDPAEQAKAAGFVLLLTHPEVEGDPAQVGAQIDEGYQFDVKIGGKEVLILTWIFSPSAHAEAFVAG